MHPKLKGAQHIFLSFLMVVFPLSYVYYNSYIPLWGWLIIGTLIYGASLLKFSSYITLMQLKKHFLKLCLGGCLVFLICFFYPKPFFLLYPFFVSLFFLYIFALSLWAGRPIITQIAEMRGHNLSKRGKIYTKRLTFIWVVFFIINGLIIFSLSLYSSSLYWGIYTSLISYILMGILFLGDFAYRTIFLSKKDNDSEA